MRPLRLSLNITVDGCYDHTMGGVDGGSLPMVFFKSMIKKAITQDLKNIMAFTERT